MSDSESDYEPEKRPRAGREREKQLKRHFLEVEASSAEEEEESDRDELSDEERKQVSTSQYPKRRMDPIFDPTADPEKQAKKFEQMASSLQQPGQAQTAQSIAQRRNLPSIEDPKLWLVSCRRGKAREAVINLMQKSLQLQAEGTPLKVFAAFASSYLDDRIYVEAFQQLHVSQAIKGLRLLFERMTIVPMDEMADVFAMDQGRRVSVKPGDFARIKTGDYKGDLAQVWRLEEHKGKAVVKVVPRLGKASGRTRPPQRMFNPQEFPNCERKMDSKSQEFFHYYQGLQFQDGFLFKTMALKSLVFGGVSPELAEVECFKRADEEQPLALGMVRKVLFDKGDKVRVVRGDMTNLRGTVVSVTDTSVVLKPGLQDLDEALDFSVNDVVKCFDVGDHVGAVSGRYKGHSGMVVAVADQTAKVICDVTKEVFPALFQDLQLCSDVSVLPNIKEVACRVNDVVALGEGKDFGLVVKVEHSSVRAVMQEGDLRVVRFSDISKTFDPRRAIARDLDGNLVNRGDMIRVVFTKHQFYEKTGSVRNTHAGTLFIYNSFFIETEGILPIKAQHCSLLGALKDQTTSCVRSDELTGKLVSINNGPYRGQTGRVTACSERMATVQLNTANKTITLDRCTLTPLEKGDIGMRVEAAPEFTKSPGHSPGWARTPAYDEAASPWGGTLASPSAGRGLRN